MTLANKITILRIVFIPVIVIGLLEEQRYWVYALLIFTMITDFLDGLVARYRGERTKLGAFLDPMADKLLLSAIYLTLTYKGIIETWIFVTVFSRDLLIVMGWTIIYILTGSSNIHPRVLGKTTTAVQMTAAVACILPISHSLIHYLLWAAVGMTIVSAIDYVIVGLKRLGEWE